MSIRSKILKELEKKPRRAKELKERLGSDKKVQRALDELVEGRKIRQQGELYFARGNDQETLLPCTMVKLSRTFGFAARQDGEGDIFIPGRGLQGAMPGDEVLVRLFEHPRVEGSQEGEVAAVTVPCNGFVGTVCKEEGRLALEPDACPGLRLIIKKSADGGAQEGEKAAVVILERGACHEEHRVGVAMRFGRADEAKPCVKALLYAAGMSKQFPEKVRAEARVFEGAEPSEAELAGRLDLRGLPIFTIDSDSTRDIDDAVSLHSLPDGGYELGVHIADVSYYVRPGSELDAEAMRRGSSVYYGDSVVPMLPRQLSNGICSLNPQKTRLAFSCLMRLDAEGRLLEHRFVKTVIHSRVKGVYAEIDLLLAGDTARPEYTALAAKYEKVMPQFAAMQQLYAKRAALRAARGALELETSEAKLEIDSEGRCVGVKRSLPGKSAGMIEEFMLLANECAAQTARAARLPFVYRVHEAPDPERREKLTALLAACGVPYHFANAAPTVQELGAVLARSRGTPAEQVVHTGVLRSMSKARYDAAPLGHFGLALADYAHFTSPIRRYADLAVHRILSEYAAGTPAADIARRCGGFAGEAAKQASAREQAAMRLERAAADRYKAEYMRGRLGQQADGVVCGITAHGIFVELENTVEGMVPAEGLCTGRPLFTEGVRLSDPLTGRSWALGDAVRITVAGVDVALGRVEFSLA